MREEPSTPFTCLAARWGISSFYCTLCHMVSVFEATLVNDILFCWTRKTLGSDLRYSHLFLTVRIFSLCEAKGTDRLLSFSRRYSCLSLCGSVREWARVCRSVRECGSEREYAWMSQNVQKWVRIGVGVSMKINSRRTKTDRSRMQHKDFHWLTQIFAFQFRSWTLSLAFLSTMTY